jgi:2',3'-cyclic-nucleotide 2'-phosphodiesterase (5'-nucleotidase family)
MYSYLNNFNIILMFLVGNFVTDIMLEISHADCAILNSGTFRSDRIHPKGWFKLRDLLTILPLVDELVVIQVTGECNRERKMFDCRAAYHNQ